MEHGWAFWWIVPMMLFFWWGPHRYRRGRCRDEGGSVRELDEGIRARLAVVDQLDARVSELENRLDFTERLLAERTTPTSNSV